MQIQNIIIHCTASLFGCAREIRRWHRARGWKDIGYHFVILNGNSGRDFKLSSLDGSIEYGRDLDGDLEIAEAEIGAHTLGYNTRSIGVVLVGIDIFTAAQLSSLVSLLPELCQKYKVNFNNVLGHYETASGSGQGKTCPNIDIENVRRIIAKVPGVPGGSEI
jgi:hypothetical protein